jgi:glycosyltransferase involved in cell wall biosynthesis
LVSVAICTFNRAVLLDDALRSFAATDKPAGVPFELLVIDNNSADATRSVVERWAAQSEFPLRYVFEGRQGLSLARNRAVKEAAGQWIWYVDDDVYFSPRWLGSVVEGLTYFPRAAALGGRVVPAFDLAKPSWLPASALPYYGLTSFGDEPRCLQPTEYPVGANVGFRRTVFDEVGLFREDLGRRGNSLLSGEEVDMVIRLHERGHEVGYVPSAEVRHRIPQDRATVSWLRRRAYWGGISCVLTDGARRSAGCFKLLRKAAWMALGASSSTLRKGLGFDDQIGCAFRLGMARQYLVEAVRSIGTESLRSGS